MTIIEKIDKHISNRHKPITEAKLENKEKKVIVDAVTKLVTEEQLYQVIYDALSEKIDAEQLTKIIKILNDTIANAVNTTLDNLEVPE